MTTIIANNPLSREDADALAARLANRTQEQAYVLYEDDGYHIASEADMSVYFRGAALLAVFEPDAVCDTTFGPDTDTARFYPDEWQAIKRCVEFSTAPIEPPPDDGPGQEGDIDGVPQGWRCRACGATHYGGGCPEVNALLYARPLAYTPKQIMKAHENRTLITLLCNLDRIELEAHAQAFAAWLCDEVARANERPASYARLPEYRALILRRWRAMLATRPLGVMYELLGQ